MRGGYEAIVIGGGHNGLAAGAYLARDGPRTVVPEGGEELEAAISYQPSAISKQKADG